MSLSSHNQTIQSIVRATMADHGMIQAGSSVVAGISGGPDSMALLHVLLELGGTMDFRVIVAHLDHALRPESTDDAAFVTDVARRMGVPAFTKRVDARAEAAGLGLSVEEAGRRLRYEFFEHLRTREGARSVATAHHRDDSLETFFLRIFRGASLRGLRGIPPKRGTIIRPLIRLGRRDIIAFLHGNEIPYRTDHTNLEADTDRNFVRNRVLPVISERFPDYAGPLERTMGLIDREDRFVEEQSEKFFASAAHDHDDEIHLDLAEFRQIPGLLRGRVVLRALYKLSGPNVRWTKVHVDAVLRIAAESNPSAKADLPAGFTARREYGRLMIRQQRSVDGVPGGMTAARSAPALTLQHGSRDSATSEGFALMVQGPGMVDILPAGVTLDFRVVPRAGDVLRCGTDANRALFDADQASFPLMVRSPRPGDRFGPWGLVGTRKLKKVLIDAKVPLSERPMLPLLVKGEDILWIPGVRRGSGAPVKPETNRVLEVRLIRSSGALCGGKGAP